MFCKYAVLPGQRQYDSRCLKEKTRRIKSFTCTRKSPWQTAIFHQFPIYGKAGNLWVVAITHGFTLATQRHDEDVDDQCMAIGPKLGWKGWRILSSTNVGVIQVFFIRRYCDFHHTNAVQLNDVTCDGYRLSSHEVRRSGSAKATYLELYAIIPIIHTGWQRNKEIPCSILMTSWCGGRRAAPRMKVFIAHFGCVCVRQTRLRRLTKSMASSVMTSL